MVGSIFIMLIAGLVLGGIGAALGSIVDKGKAGFWLGAFLGPVGWIIVFLLPRETTASSAVSSPTTARPVVNSSAETSPKRPKMNLESDAYRIWLVDTYKIVKDDTFGQFICQAKLFDTLDEAIGYAHQMQAEKDQRNTDEVAAREIARHEQIKKLRNLDT